MFGAHVHDVPPRSGSFPIQRRVQFRDLHLLQPNPRDVLRRCYIPSDLYFGVSIRDNQRLFRGKDGSTKDQKAQQWAARGTYTGLGVVSGPFVRWVIVCWSGWGIPFDPSFASFHGWSVSRHDTDIMEGQIVASLRDTMGVQSGGLRLVRAVLLEVRSRDRHHILWSLRSITEVRNTDASTSTTS